MKVTLWALMRSSIDELTAHGIEGATTDVEWMLSSMMGCRRCDLYLRREEVLEDTFLQNFREKMARRLRREPLQHILGTADFYGESLEVSSDVLIPRPETEEMVEWVLGHTDAYTERSLLDLGTGSGAIAITLAKHLPLAHVTASDISERALSMAQKNAKLCGVADRITFLKSHWFSLISGKFDVIVSNPPYLTIQEVKEASPEVREYEPMTALVSGKDGLDDIRIIISQCANFLKPGGYLVVETGIHQHKSIAILAEKEHGTMWSYHDLSGRQRFIVLLF